MLGAYYSSLCELSRSGLLLFYVTVILLPHSITESYSFSCITDCMTAAGAVILVLIWCRFYTWGYFVRPAIKRLWLDWDRRYIMHDFLLHNLWSLSRQELLQFSHLSIKRLGCYDHVFSPALNYDECVADFRTVLCMTLWILLGLQCFDAVGWVSGRPPGP